MRKLQKIKEHVVSSADYVSLDKCSAKVEKLKPRALEVKKNRHLLEILDTIDQLVKEKTKYFKQKMLIQSRKISSASKPNSDADRTLKYSKSAESINTIMPYNPTGHENAKTLYKSRRGGDHDKHYQRAG